MYDYFKKIEKEFLLSNYANVEKIEKARDKKLSFNSLNQNERQLLNYNKTYIMLPYNTVFADLISYYIIECDVSGIIDVLKVNICLRSNAGYFIHSVHSKVGRRDEEKNIERKIIGILKNDLDICEFGPLGYSEHADLAYMIDPKRNSEQYFKD